jgi:hypothetical protein
MDGPGWKKKIIFYILERCWNAPGPFYYYFPVDGWTPSDFKHFQIDSSID